MTDRPEEEDSDIEQASRDGRAVDPGRSSSRRSLAVIAGLVLVGLLLNSMLWYTSHPKQRGLVRHDDLNLSTLVVTEQRTVRLRYGFATYLHDVARGGVIAVPDGDVVDQRKVENLSQMDIVVADYDETITQARIDALSPGVEITGLGSVGQDGEDVVYQFLMRDDSLAPSVTYFVIANQVVIVDDRLLER